MARRLEAVQREVVATRRVLLGGFMVLAIILFGGLFLNGNFVVVALLVLFGSVGIIYVLGTVIHALCRFWQSKSGRRRGTRAPARRRRRGDEAGRFFSAPCSLW